MQAPLDFKTIEPISYKNTVSIINNFVINTSDFLNKFSYYCEKKLMEVSQNIERLEITMNILEAKLASIPGLEGSAPPPFSTTASSAPVVDNSNSSAPPPPPPPPGASTTSS